MILAPASAQEWHSDALESVRQEPALHSYDLKYFCVIVSLTCNLILLTWHCWYQHHTLINIPETINTSCQCSVVLLQFWQINPSLVIVSYDMMEDCILTMYTLTAGGWWRHNQETQSFSNVNTQHLLWRQHAHHALLWRQEPRCDDRNWKYKYWLWRGYEPCLSAVSLQLQSSTVFFSFLKLIIRIVAGKHRTNQRVVLTWFTNTWHGPTLWSSLHFINQAALACGEIVTCNKGLCHGWRKKYLCGWLKQKYLTSCAIKPYQSKQKQKIPRLVHKNFFLDQSLLQTRSTSILIYCSN